MAASSAGSGLSLAGRTSLTRLTGQEHAPPEGVPDAKIEHLSLSVAVIAGYDLPWPAKDGIIFTATTALEVSYMFEQQLRSPTVV